MEARDIIEDILDRLEEAQRARFRAESEANEAGGRAFRAEHEAARAKTEAEDIRTSWNRAETRLTIALRLLTDEQRGQYEAAVNPPKTDASGEVIPF